MIVMFDFLYYYIDINKVAEIWQKDEKLAVFAKRPKLDTFALEATFKMLSFKKYCKKSEHCRLHVATFPRTKTTNTGLIQWHIF